LGFDFTVRRVHIKGMVDREKIQFDLIKLLNGERILRLTEPQSGLSLEKKLSPADAVVRQKESCSACLEPRSRELK